MKRVAILSLAALISICSGCIVLDHEHPGCVGAYCNETPGEIAFFWSFELADEEVTDSCVLAEISRVDVIVYNGWGELEFEALDRPCEEYGATIDNFWPGSYEIQLVGICPSGRITHEGWWDFEVYSGKNDLGTLVLDYLRPCD